MGFQGRLRGGRSIVKRGFLFGLGSFLIVSVIGGLSGALIGTARLAAIITALICIPLGVFVIRRAIFAPPPRYRCGDIRCNRRSNSCAFAGEVVKFWRLSRKIIYSMQF